MQRKVLEDIGTTLCGGLSGCCSGRGRLPSSLFIPPIPRKLDVAVGEEDYEMAARLRDERKVEGWIEGGPG